MRIVAVDPSRTVLKCLARLLEGRGHEVIGFTEGAEALARIACDPTIDGAIVSAEQTATSGTELSWHIRLLASPGRPIYIILMSSHDAKRTLVEGLDSGADDFITKPPHPDELYARLRAAERVTQMQRDLVRLATTDSLTGTLNRRAFFQRLEESCNRAHEEMPVSAIMMDIDHFKTINDRYGHGVGDDVIRAVAGQAMQTSRIVGRLGGEEFALVIEAEVSSALRAAERLREYIAALRIDAAGAVVRATCSLGVSEWQSGEACDEFLRRADIALYAAKAGGRNQVIFDQPGLWVVNYDERQSPVRAQPRPAPAA